MAASNLYDRTRTDVKEGINGVDGVVETVGTW